MKKRGAPIKHKDFEISKRIKEARKEKFTQEELAQKLNVSLQTIKNWEQERNIPGDETLKKIAQLCNVDFLWLKNIDSKSIIENSKQILVNFDIESLNYSVQPSLAAEAKYKCILEALTMCGYRYDEIINPDYFFKFMDSSIISMKNAIELYMKTLNEKEK